MKVPGFGPQGSAAKIRGKSDWSRQGQSFCLGSLALTCEAAYDAGRKEIKAVLRTF